MAQVHRFHTRAAISFHGTRYLTPTEAREVAAALIECADDIEARSFSDSTFSTRRLPDGLTATTRWPEEA